jgi:hypothetical protein
MRIQVVPGKKITAERTVLPEQIKAFVKENSYMSFDEKDGTDLFYATRKSGDPETDQYGQEDLDHVIDLGRKILAEFNMLRSQDVVITNTGEWINLQIILPKESLV